MLKLKPEISRVYKDIDLSFTSNAFTEDVDKVYDVSSVKQSLKNLLFTSYFERLYHPEIGSPLAGLLFEQADPLSVAAIEKAIENIITNYEPRCNLTSVYVSEDTLDINTIRVEIRFFVVGVDLPEQTFVSTLYRTR